MLLVGESRDVIHVLIKKSLVDQDVTYETI